MTGNLKERRFSIGNPYIGRLQSFHFDNLQVESY